MTVSAAYFGIAEGLTKNAVIKSFYNTGIWPWNPERILGNANITSSSTEHSSFPPADASLERSSELVRDLLAEHLSSTRINCAPTRSVEVHGEPRPLLGSDMERLRRDRERARQEKADRVQAEREAEKGRLHVHTTVSLLLSFFAYERSHRILRSLLSLLIFAGLQLV